MSEDDREQRKAANQRCLEKLEAKWAANPYIPMTPVGFLERLAALNSADIPALLKFIEDAGDVQEAIPIGKHGTLSYFIECTDDVMVGGKVTTEESSFPGTFYSIREFHPQPIPSGDQMQCPLEYGFTLGRLFHQGPDDPTPDDSGFYVLCNLIDKSIWIAFNFRPIDAITCGPIIIAPERGHEWGYLPDRTKTDIGALQLFDGQWTSRMLEKYPEPSNLLTALADQHPFENYEQRRYACKLHTRQASPMELEYAFIAAGIATVPNGPKAHALRTKIVYREMPYD